MSNYKKIPSYTILFLIGVLISTGMYYSLNIRGIKNKDKLENKQKQSIELDKSISDLEKELKELE